MLMDKLPNRQSEVNRFIWNMYHRRRMSAKIKLLIGVLGLALLGLIVGLDNLLRIVILVFLLAIIVGIGFWFGFEYGEYQGETNERKRILDEGYSLRYRVPPGTDDDVKPLRTCRWCGHITDED